MRRRVEEGKSHVVLVPFSEEFFLVLLAGWLAGRMDGDDLMDLLTDPGQVLSHAGDVTLAAVCF